MRATGSKGEHLSGAEGIYPRAAIGRTAREYLARALSHPRGAPHSVVITSEELTSEPLSIPVLQLGTLECPSPQKARSLAACFLRSAGISDAAIKAAFGVLRGARAMRGAALVHAISGVRLEADPTRGVRASMLGYDSRALSALRRRLRPQGLDTQTVLEALALASKVASAPGIVAELCASDDPHYTTGYVASQAFGYLRLPSIKRAGSSRGGRVFFIAAKADVSEITAYLQSRPVLIGGRGRRASL